ncbi:MAG: carbohydrate kinase family protein [Candidatus Magasanikbacteria bacterium]|nr:carbohydrate kinase family protein [Candidatus Magasanikbacteria bacterium]
MYHLICIGDPVIDTHVQLADDCAECRPLTAHTTHLCFEYGGKIPILDGFQALGGNAPNVAVGAVKLGLRTAVVATLGEDINGKMAAEALQKFGVSTDYVTYDAAAKTRYSIVLNYKAERTILSFSDRKQYQWPKPFPETDWIYYTGLSAGFETVHQALLQYLTKHPTVRLAVNPGSYLMKYARPPLQEVAFRADLLIVNKEEAEALTGDSAAAKKDTPGLVRALAAAGAKEVALTDGPRGAWAGSIDEIWRLESFPVAVVAKTGAGDAFTSAYLTARWNRHDIGHALQWGVANSCAVIQAHGPHQGLLDEAGIKKMIGQFPTIKPVLIP